MPSAAAPDPVAVDDGLGELFWSVARQMRHRARDGGLPHDLSPSLGRALVTLMRSEPMRLSALSERLRIAARSTTEVVDGLEEKGLVVRRPDPGDRRATLVEVTDAGREAGAAMRQARSEQAEVFFARLSDADRARLAKILRTLLDD